MARTFRHLGFALSIALLAGSAARSAPKNDAGQRYRQAQAAMDQKQFPKAAELLEALYAEDPAVLGYGLLLAEAYLQQKQPAKARSLLVELARRPPKDVDAKILLAQMLGKIERWPEIIAVLEPAARNNKDDHTLHHLLAQAYDRQGQTRQAIEQYEAAIAANPATGKNYEALGHIHLRAGRDALAAESFLKAVARGVHTPGVHFALAQAFFDLGNYLGRPETRVIENTQAGQLLDDGFVLSDVRNQKNTFHVCPVKSGLFQIERSIALGNRQPAAQFLRGAIRLEIGRYEEALADFVAVEKKLAEKQAADYHARRARAHLGLEEYDAYLEHTKLAAKAAPATYGQRMASAYAEVAERYGQRGQLDDHIRYLELAVRSARRDSTMHCLLGYAYWDAHEHKKAAEHFQIVLELAPNFAQRAELLDLIEEAAKETAQPE